jgi:hypothetical protein
MGFSSKRLRPLSTKAQRNLLPPCDRGLQLPALISINEACRRAPAKLQALATRTINKKCGGRLRGPKK